MINIVVKSGWILERMARELATRLPAIEVNAGRDIRTVDDAAALHYYMPAKDAKKIPPPGPMIGLFTHGENGFNLIPACLACVTMNVQMADRIRALGARNVQVIRPGTEAPARPPVFGVIGRVYNDGRKGERLIAQAVRAGFTVRACGAAQRVHAMRRRQWPCETTHTVDEREAFFDSIDYLLVPSLEEGGPMPVLEALARRVPVIAPDVGWCWEYPVIRYDRGSWPSLQAVLEGLSVVPTWERWADEHAQLFARLRVAA